MIPSGQKFTIGVSQNALRMAHGGITCYDRGGLDSEQNYVTGSLSETLSYYIPSSSYFE